MAEDGAVMAAKCRLAKGARGGHAARWPGAQRKKIRPEGRKKLQQQAQQLAGTSQCGEKFIMYEINNKMWCP
ncbi:hypothetical protein [Achromobacter ruhlandii]|uniref:hypothetical protein n=1 Tax=Achromobacter ruhlandii TaxID=72557 RepID=UPI0011875B9F|nr:hypothetical protein [Achromobacter ruhlandii]MCZ8433346.1 hypothetical protein [Achromobacter ruhlandii]MDC6090841.1 hypothetical protein [Achromobacter ruhlandii]MDC6148667.1 hypothetical protein [Achromobacter ruhlandii]MDD7977876.1 hypothetical protein [Achromobacter ruhlandii]WIW00594.1 hypothetical protein PPH40_015800 [Achromobacter ruhlandii]